MKLQNLLESGGYSVYAAYNGKEALNIYEEIEPSLVVLDLMLPDILGEDIFKVLKLNEVQ